MFRYTSLKKVLQDKAKVNQINLVQLEQNLSFFMYIQVFLKYANYSSTYLWPIWHFRDNKI